MPFKRLLAPLAILCAALLATLGAASAAYAQPAPLKDVASFSSIQDRDQRSRALFTEAGKVILSPRCLNCHPNGDSPTQGLEMRKHLPSVARGPDSKGVVPMQCATCHQAANFEPSGVPGHPLWHLAPLSMAWQGKTLGQVCEQIKDRKRNGGRTLAEIHEHMAHDTLVGWGWNPGGKRTPAPGTQAQFGALIAAWIETGAACPGSSAGNASLSDADVKLVASVVTPGQPAPQLTPRREAAPARNASR